jgi:hypothetical protein
MRSDKIIAEFVHENLIAGINVATRDHLAAFVTRTACHLEIVRQGRLWSVDPMRPTVSNDARPGKEEKILLFYDFADRLVIGRDHVDVVAAENEELGNLLENIGSRRRRRMADDSVKRRLH